MGLGLHGGGLGTTKFLARHGALVTVTDLRSKSVLAPVIRELRGLKNIRYILGRHRKKDFSQAELIFKNPGVPPDSPLLKYAQKLNIPITSDVAFFLEHCPARIIGVTGTRGKSTTVKIIGGLLALKYKGVFIGGNIRKSVLKILPHLKSKDWAVLELSSFQLHDLNYQSKKERLNIHYAVLTNILRDHLNWHKNFSSYVNSKKNIFRWQKGDDYLFINTGDKLVKRLVKKAPAKIIYANSNRSYQKIVQKNLGKHYLPSVALAVSVAKKLGIKDKQIKKFLRRFRGLEGREEKIASLKGIHFINDTTATSPDATIAAILRFSVLPPRNKKIILIAGGQDKRLYFTKMAEAIKRRVDSLVLLPGTATQSLKRELKKTKLKPNAVKLKNVREVKSIREAVQTAYRLAKKGDYVILSPGAASFGLFLNEFDRGEKFAEELTKLKSATK